MTMQGADMNHTTDPETVFRILKPTELDRLADDGYQRRRDGDLARITAASQGRQSSRRRRPSTYRVIAGAAACAVATAGIVIVSTGHEGHRAGTRQPAAAAPAVLDARTFLLASAQTAEKTPVTTGRYWYTRERRTEWTSTLMSPVSKTKKPPKKPKKVTLSSTASIATTEDSWIARGGHDRSQTILGIDTKTTLSPADEATWKAMGSPALDPGIPSTPLMSSYDIPLHFQIGNKQVTMDELATLPTDASRLEAELKRRYEADLRAPGYLAELKSINSKPASFATVVWDTAENLLAGPITPGTRAALYRLLAEQPGIKLLGTATDTSGRHGVALTMSGGSPGFTLDTGPTTTQDHLIIDPRSAQLLAFESYALDSSGRTGRRVLSSTYSLMGWTNNLGGRP
jgi:hypothetical protein